MSSLRVQPGNVLLSNGEMLPNGYTTFTVLPGYTTKIQGFEFHIIKFCNKCGTTCEIHKNGTLTVPFREKSKAGNVYLCKSACTVACMYNMLIYML